MKNLFSKTSLASLAVIIGASFSHASDFKDLPEELISKIFRIVGQSEGHTLGDYVALASTCRDFQRIGRDVHNVRFGMPAATVFRVFDALEVHPEFIPGSNAYDENLHNELQESASALEERLRTRGNPENTIPSNSTFWDSLEVDRNQLADLQKLKDFGAHTLPSNHVIDLIKSLDRDLANTTSPQFRPATFRSRKRRLATQTFLTQEQLEAFAPHLEQLFPGRDNFSADRQVYKLIKKVPAERAAIIPSLLGILASPHHISYLDQCYVTMEALHRSDTEAVSLLECVEKVRVHIPLAHHKIIGIFRGVPLLQVEEVLSTVSEKPYFTALTTQMRLELLTDVVRLAR